MSLPRTWRLRRGDDFRQVRRAGRSWANRWVALYAWRPATAAGAGPGEARMVRAASPAGAAGVPGDPAGGPGGPAIRVGRFGPTAAAAVPVTRVGFTVGRRLGKAVRRNRVRRLLAEAYRQLAPRVEPGWWLVVVARDAAAGMDWKTARRALEDVLGKARLLRPPATGGLRDARGNGAGPTGATGGGGEPRC
ncbi:ribonuclease P protein component [Thermaerobacter marianensis DSM 12885]|uniref:Ribonuclease P protein component n=1 Tax=Thermaerobacter marianensis (strain ATCC 700841 / DSM 12885 / JCM 10246 / 7p75a) TaxID=644966 RepID=E6SLZ2_THEM7|nr:ribonuclease P protein component [Thermaerobacter marianensis]ADU52450.1 ribonuclease P protein component [Thermaerobacter marianensis DSM 12885]